MNLLSLNDREVLLDRPPPLRSDAFGLVFQMVGAVVICSVAVPKVLSTRIIVGESGVTANAEASVKIVFSISALLEVAL